MSRRDPLTMDREVALGDVQVGTTHAAGAHLHEQLVRAGRRHRFVDELDGVLTDGAGPVD